MNFRDFYTNKQNVLETAIAFALGFLLIGHSLLFAVLAGAAVYGTKWSQGRYVLGNGRVAQIVNRLGLFTAVWLVMFLLGFFVPVLGAVAFALVIGSMTVFISSIISR